MDFSKSANWSQSNVIDCLKIEKRRIMLELLGEASQFSNLAQELQFSRGDAIPFLYVVF
jgi:hypothetical protein